MSSQIFNDHELLSFRRLSCGDNDILLVGDRSVDHPETVRNCLRTRLMLGAFTRGTGRVRLMRVGLRWKYSATLLPATPQLGYRATEDYGNGQAMAELLKQFAKEQNLRIVLAGEFAALSFGLKFQPMNVFQAYAMIHHPLGFNRFWSKASSSRDMKEFVKDNELGSNDDSASEVQRDSDSEEQSDQTEFGN